MRQVQNFIREQKMIMPGDFVIAGVSGGADSVCLFFELLAYQKEIPFSMEVVHIEHGIRGQDSLADANYVENLCKEYGVPFHLVSCDIKKMAQESSLTVEEAGRKARYQAFEQAAKKSGRQSAVGQTATTSAVLSRCGTLSVSGGGACCAEGEEQAVANRVSAVMARQCVSFMSCARGLMART